MSPDEKLVSDFEHACIRNAKLKMCLEGNHWSTCEIGMARRAAQKDVDRLRQALLEEMRNPFARRT